MSVAFSVLGTGRSVTFGIRKPGGVLIRLCLMASGIFGESRSIYARFLLMILGEVIAGAILYVIFAFMPVAVQMLIAVASWAIVVNENLTFPKNKSLGSFLCEITGAASFSCGVAWRITHQEFWSRLVLVGTCLLAGLIFLDRRQEWLDLD